MRSNSWLCVCAVLAFSALAFSAPALADKATAQALFEEGRALMAKGDFAAACPKLEESQKQDPGMGTQFRLAECYEGLGRTATAWANYLEVADLAKAAGQDQRELVARERATKLFPSLARLEVSAPTTEGLVVKRDGVVLGAAQLGVALPVDPGKHEVEVSAPGRKTFHTTVTVTKGEKARVAVPELAPEGGEPAHEGPRRTVSLVVTGVGAVALGASLFVGLSARSKWHESDGHCDGNLCDPDGLSARDAGRSRGNLATLLFVGGAVVATTGLVLFFTAPKQASPSGALRLGVGLGTVSLGGSF